MSHWHRGCNYGIPIVELEACKENVEDDAV
jgi:hypothetical protein